MNELKILITASTSAAKKAVKEVRDEIDKVNQSANKNGKSITESMKAVAKSAAIAVGAITAITGAMAALGRSAQEVNKGFEKLNTAFKSAGSTSAQATKTYKELFGILGDHDRTIETAQSLARVTTEVDKLSEYYNILAGAVAKYGDGYNSEAFSENIAETIAEGKATGDLVRVLVEAGIAEDAFNNSLAQATSMSEREVIVRNTLNNALGKTGALYIMANQATIRYNQSQANLNIALSQAARYTTPLLTAINNLGASLLTVLAPALQTVSVYLTAFIQLMVSAIQWVGGFFGVFSSKTQKTKGDVEGYKKAMDNYLNSLSGGFNKSGAGIDSNINKLKELKKQTMGFDELNVVSSQDASASGGGGGGGASIGTLPPMPKPEDYGLDYTGGLEDLTKEIETAKEKIKGILTLVGIVGGAFAAWKLTDFVAKLWDSYKTVKALKDAGVDLDKHWNDLSQAESESVTHLTTMKQMLQKIGGYMMIIAGTILLVKGYTDAWVNGVDWGNFALMLSGIGLIVGGLALAFGPVAAGVGAIAGGIALLVVGVKDFVKNGYSMENVLTILAGVIAICAGVALAFNAALGGIGLIVVAVVAGIALLVAGFVILWNECDGFRNFWIALWEIVKQAFSKFVKTLEPLIDALVNAFTEAWELIQVIWKDYLVPLFKWAWEAIKAVWDFVKPYFEAKWNAIKLVFSVVADVLGSYFKMAWEVIKVVWDVVVSYFAAIWNSIAGIFSVVKNVLQGNWQAAWDGVKGIVGTWVNFFSGVWEGIKKVFSAVATFFKDVFGKAWDAVLKVFSATGQVFKGIAEGILNVFKKVVNFLIDGINKVVKLPFEGLNTILNKIHGISIAGVKPFSWLTWRAPIPQLPKLAKGGVVDSATIAMIGEAGKEAVVPLENNTQWMDKLAEKLAARSNNPTKVILKIGEKELGWATIGAINGITEQTGGLQLVL